MADEVAVGSGDFSDVISMVFGEQRFVDGATVILDSPLELHERTIDGLRFARALKTRGTRWLDVLKVLVSYRLIDPGSEWRLHREWYEHTAMGDLLGHRGEAIELQSLYRCQDKLLAHKQELV